MKKKYYTFLFTFLLVLINSCAGYEPIFSSTNLKFKISTNLVEGNKILGNKIFSKLYNASFTKEQEENIKERDVFIKVLRNKSETSKDSAVKVLEYKITLNADIIIKDFNSKNTLINQTFISSLNYKVQDQYSETLNLENQTNQNLINKIYQELLIKLSENIQ